MENNKEQCRIDIDTMKKELLISIFPEHIFLDRYILPYVENLLDIYKHCRETEFILDHYVDKIKQQFEVLQKLDVDLDLIAEAFFKKMQRRELFLFLDSLEELEDQLVKCHCGKRRPALELYEDLELFEYGDIVSRHCVLPELRGLLDRRTPKNVLLVSGDEAIPAHEVILRARSSTFADMFPDDEVGENSCYVELPLMEEAELKNFVWYIYTGRTTQLDWNSATTLYEVAHLYAVKGLQTLCANFLAIHLTKERCVECLLLAHAHSDDDFKANLIDYMYANEVPYHLHPELFDCLYKK